MLRLLKNISQKISRYLQETALYQWCHKYQKLILKFKYKVLKYKYISMTIGWYLSTSTQVPEKYLNTFISTVGDRW